MTQSQSLSVSIFVRIGILVWEVCIILVPKCWYLPILSKIILCRKTKVRNKINKTKLRKISTFIWEASLTWWVVSILLWERERERERKRRDWKREEMDKWRAHLSWSGATGFVNRERERTKKKGVDGNDRLFFSFLFTFFLCGN